MAPDDNLFLWPAEGVGRLGDEPSSFLGSGSPGDIIRRDFLAASCCLTSEYELFYTRQIYFLWFTKTVMFLPDWSLQPWHSRCKILEPNSKRKQGRCRWSRGYILKAVWSSAFYQFCFQVDHSLFSESRSSIGNRKRSRFYLCLCIHKDSMDFRLQLGQQSDWAGRNRILQDTH